MIAWALVGGLTLPEKGRLILRHERVAADLARNEQLPSLPLETHQVPRRWLWAGGTQSRGRCGRGERSSGADVGRRIPMARTALCGCCSR
jgi:hypothetical protein